MESSVSINTLSSVRSMLMGYFSTSTEQMTLIRMITARKATEKTVAKLPYLRRRLESIFLKSIAF